MRSLRLCKSRDESNEILRAVIQDAVDKAGDELFTVGLSGGSLVDTLVAVLPSIKTDWKKWLFFFCDERMVDFDDKQSTFGAYKKHLLPKLPIDVNQFVIIDPNLKGNDCSVDYTSKMKLKFPAVSDKELPKFSLLLLGMGPDGHTCSLFPGHPLLKETSQWIAYIGNSPKPPPERVTFTFPVINNAKLVVFVVNGNEKANPLKEILIDNKKLPAGMVQPVHGDLVWIIGEDSAQYIPENMFTK